MRRHDKTELREINHCRNEREFQDQVLQTCIWVEKPLKILIPKRERERPQKIYRNEKQDIRTDMQGLVFLNKTEEQICKGFFNYKRVRWYNSVSIFHSLQEVDHFLGKHTLLNLSQREVKKLQ